MTISAWIPMIRMLPVGLLRLLVVAAAYAVITMALAR